MLLVWTSWNYPRINCSESKRINKLNRLLKYLILAGLLILPVTLFVLPADFFDQGEVLCPSKRFLDLECLGCGITRGIQHAIHFEFEEAWAFNKLTFVVLPIGIIIWIHILLRYGFDYDLFKSLKEKFKSIFNYPAAGCSLFRLRF